MADENRQFDQQVHDAFERIELGDGAQERILANLLAAQEMKLSSRGQGENASLEETRQAEMPQEAAERVESSGMTADANGDRATEEESGVTDNKVVPFTRRRFGWRMLLPLAAVLAVAMIVVQATGMMGGKKSDSQAIMSDQSYASSESKEADGAAAEGSAGTDEGSATIAENNAETMTLEDSVELDAAEEAPLAAEGASALTSVDYYPCVMLEDGTVLTTLREGLYTEEVSSDEVGELVGKAIASSFDDPQNEFAVSCTVYSLKHESGAYAVQYESETTYWRCRPIG